MPTKSDIAKRIMKLHPRLGVKHNLSEYIGGKIDYGRWFIWRLKEVKKKELLNLYEQFCLENNGN